LLVGLGALLALYGVWQFVSFMSVTRSVIRGEYYTRVVPDIFLRTSFSQYAKVMLNFVLPGRETYPLQRYKELELAAEPSQQSVRLLHITQNFGPSLDSSFNELNHHVLTSLAVKQQESPLYNVSIIMPYYPAIKKKYKPFVKKFANLNTLMTPNGDPVNFRVSLLKWNHTSLAEESRTIYNTMNVFLIEPADRKPYNVPFAKRQTFALEQQDVYFAKAASELVLYLETEEGTSLFDAVMDQDAEDDENAEIQTVVHVHGSDSALAIPFLHNAIAPKGHRIVSAAFPELTTVYSMNDDLTQELLTHFDFPTLSPYLSQAVLESSLAHANLAEPATLFLPSVSAIRSANHIVLPSQQLGKELVQTTIHPALSEAIFPDLLQLAKEARFHGISNEGNIDRLWRSLCLMRDLASPDCLQDVMRMKELARLTLSRRMETNLDDTLLIYHHFGSGSLHKQSFRDMMSLMKDSSRPFLLFSGTSPDFTLQRQLAVLLKANPSIQHIANVEDNTLYMVASDLLLPDASLTYSAYKRQLTTAAFLGLTPLPLFTPIAIQTEVNVGLAYNPFELHYGGPHAVDVQAANQTLGEFNLSERQIGVEVRSELSSFDQVSTLLSTRLDADVLFVVRCGLQSSTGTSKTAIRIRTYTTSCRHI